MAIIILAWLWVQVTPVFIEVEDLRDDPLHFEHVYGLGELRFERDDSALEEAVSVEFILTHEERDLRLGGTVVTGVRCTCSRCLKEFSRRLATSFDLIYLPHPATTKVDEEIELKYDDMDVGYYDGVRLDVDLMVMEQIELSLPMRFVCRDECRGLCYKCGADLNEGACLCILDETDSRLAALLDFRKRMQQ